MIKSMKYLGIDYGEKRVGIAISDVEGKVAFPKIVLENNTELTQKISDLCKEFEVGVIVIGESKDYKGEDNKISPKIISFKRELSSAIKLPISLEPEFMSSMQVEKTFGKTDMLDASAAAIILQTFMDKEKNRQSTKQKAVENEKISAQDGSASGGKINYDDFKKVEMKVGKILSVEAVIGSNKLYKLSVDFLESEPRQIVSGIAHYFPDSQKLLGKKVAFVTNLEPRPLMGLLSNGMILAVKSEDSLVLMEVPDFVKEGTILN
ncbi:MAG: Holliday junction resolvase RuvX [bacterium]